MDEYFRRVRRRLKVVLWLLLIIGPPFVYLAAYPIVDHCVIYMTYTTDPLLCAQIGVVVQDSSSATWWIFVFWWAFLLGAKLGLAPLRPAIVEQKKGKVKKH